jgi:3-oxoacyl-[acyl-carrier-protein] synthase I
VSAVALLNAGLVTSAGFSAPSTYAAIRAKVGNPSVTRFRGGTADWLMVHQVDLPWRGVRKLAVMASIAIEECLVGTSLRVAPVLLLCVSEPTRPGRIERIDEEILPTIEAELGMRFDRARSRVVAQGRIGAFVALARARQLLHGGDADHVVVAAADSLVVRGTLAGYCEQDRILSEPNSNGFIPGEGAGAVLVGRNLSHPQAVACLGIGTGMETATVLSDEPLRAAGLTAAIAAALNDAGNVAFEQIDVRISDISGEQYGFKDAALAAARLLRKRRAVQDLWHPAETVGEIGSAIGLVMLSIARSAFTQGHLQSPVVLLHAGNDAGQRAACAIGAAAARRVPA